MGNLSIAKTSVPSNNVSAIWPYLSFLLIAIIIPNAPYSYITNHFDLYRPLVNIDYIIPALLMVVGHRPHGIILLLTFMIIDILSVIPQIFPHIQHLSDVLELLPFVFMAPKVFIVTIVLTLLYLALTALLLYFLGRHSNLKSGFVVFNVALCLHIYNAIAAPASATNSQENQHSSVISSQIIYYFNYRNSLATSEREQIHMKPVAYTGELANWFRLPDEQLPERMLLIVNESWGTSTVPHVDEALLSPLLMRKNKLQNIKYGSQTYPRGGTLVGELRELCSIEKGPMLIKNIVEGFDNCLPNRLINNGYHTYAMHGAPGEVYNRKYWYPRAGFEKQTFFDTKPWPSKCESFPGACDLDMRDEVAEYFALPGKRFMYWITLNSHIPYSSNDVRYDVFNCENMGVGNNTETCHYLKLQAQFFYGLAEMVDDPRMEGVTVRVIGDHPTPLFNSTEKLKYFKKDSIDWLEFTTNSTKTVNRGVLTNSAS